MEQIKLQAGFVLGFSLASRRKAEQLKTIKNSR
jgi:hypothetical protein